MTAQDQTPSGKPSGKHRALRPAAIFGGLLAAAAAVAGVVTLNGEDKAEAAAESSRETPRQSVTVIDLQPQTLARSLSLSGEARPRTDVRVFAPTSGVRVTDLLVDEGDFVKRGQAMARLDPNVAQAQIAAAQAAVAEAQAAATQATGEAERAEMVKDSGAISQEALEARRAQARAAEARLKSAQAQLAEVGGRLQGGYIRAPRAGLVIERAAEVGQLVDGQLLFRIVGDNALEVGAEVGEADMLALKRGQTAEFVLVNGERVTGKLRRLPAAINSQTRTGEAVFDLERSDRLRAGMFLRGQASVAIAESIVVPQSAVVYDNGSPSVFVVAEGNRVSRQPVTVAQRAGDMVSIASGLNPGQRVVSGGAAFLQDGDLINPIRPEATAPAAQANVRKGG